MTLVEAPKCLKVSKQAYALLEAILVDGPWKHRLHPYGMEQTKLIDSTLKHLQHLLDGTSKAILVDGPLSTDTILAVFKRASPKHKTVLSFLYDDYNHDSPFAFYYMQLSLAKDSATRCEALGYNTLLHEHGLDPKDRRNTDAIMILADWYKSNLTDLSYANYGQWDWLGFSDCVSFLNGYMDILNEHCILYGQNLLPDSYGMSIVDRVMRKRGIKIRLTGLERANANAFRKRLSNEKHEISYTPFDPHLVGNVEAELTARANYAKMMRGGTTL
jgi:hypothetical protein